MLSEIVRVEKMVTNWPKWKVLALDLMLRIFTQNINPESTELKVN